MSNIMKLMRERFGQPQQWWAGYLGITLAQVKMAETGNRSLPAPAMLKLAHLEILSQRPEFSDTIQMHTVAMVAAANEPLTNQADKMEYQAMVAKRKLKVLQQQYIRAMNSLATAALLLQKEATTKQERKDKRAMETLQYEAAQQLKQCGPQAQAYLQWKIDCYTYGIKRAKELTINSRK